jgi:hypothetical protein
LTIRPACQQSANGFEKRVARRSARWDCRGKGKREGGKVLSDPAGERNANCGNVDVAFVCCRRAGIEIGDVGSSKRVKSTRQIGEGNEGYATRE